jgi:EmrB/QacA subfamily drug resistance transporter
MDRTAAAAPALHPLTQLGLLAGPLLSMVDSSIVNVAVTDISRQLHATLPATEWVISGYLLALSAGLAATAYLARRWGTLPVYTASLVGFVAASAACAAAPSVPVLVGLRVLQGLAGAPLVPLAMSMLLGGGAPQGGADSPARQIPVAAGLLFFLAPALGPTLGGTLIAAGGWRWIFLVNVPIGLVGLAGLRRIPAGVAPGRAPGARFDPIGLVLLSVGLTLAVYGASHGAAHDWATPATALPLGAAAVLLFGYAGWGSRREHPAVDLGILRHGGAALGLALGVVSSVVAFAAVFLLPIFTQAVQGHSALATGLALLPQGVATGLGTVLGQRLQRRFGIRPLVVCGFTLLAVASSGLLLLDAGTPLWATATLLCGRAVSIGLVVTPLLSVLLSRVTSDRLADGNTLFNIANRLGGSLGVSLLGSLLAARSAVVGPIAAFHDVGLVLTALALLAAVASLALPRSERPAAVY